MTSVKYSDYSKPMAIIRFVAKQTNLNLAAHINLNVTFRPCFAEFTS